MFNKIMKFLIPIITIITIFFINTIEVKAGYKNSIECIYVLPKSYYQGSVSTSTDEVIISYRRANAETTLIYKQTLNNSKENKKFHDNKFDDYIIGKGDGSESKRGENYRTCPSWVSYEVPITNRNISPISKETFYNGKHSGSNKSNVHIGATYVTEVYLTDDGIFTDSETSKRVPDAWSVTRVENPYFLFLKKETIDGIETDKGKRVSKEYFEKVYFDANAENILTSVESSSFDINYIDLTNYSFETYEEFSAYALSSTIGNEKYDSGISQDLWKQRWHYFYRFQQWEDFATYLETSYKNIFNENYENDVYKKMKQYYKLPQEKNVFGTAEEIEDLEYSNESYSHDSCLVECANANGILPESAGEISTCKNHDQGYIDCHACDNQCKNTSSAQEACMKGCLGEEKYNKIEEVKDNNKEKLEELKDKLYNVKAPSLDIGFDPDGYKVQCEDVEMLHFIYAAMRIIAPILVIVFGMFDYTKSVFAADEQKILEARKKFPKRLILLILFILVPLIIDLILGVFGPDTSLMKCIISG